MSTLIHAQQCLVVRHTVSLWHLDYQPISQALQHHRMQQACLESADPAAIRGVGQLASLRTVCCGAVEVPQRVRSSTPHSRYDSTCGTINL